MPKGIKNQEPENKGSEKVEVNKQGLEQMLKDMADLKDQVKTLTAVADKSRVAWYEGMNPKKKVLSQITIATFPVDGKQKLVLGWTNLPLNEMYQDTNGAWHEKQVMELVLEGEKDNLQINYVDFVRRKKSVKAEIVSRQKDEETGSETLTVETVDDHKKFEIDSTFINV